VWIGECKERAFVAITDLLLLSMFLSLSPQVREASAVAAVRGESRDMATLQVSYNNCKFIVFKINHCLIN
jgi:hypothetical protein